MYTVPPGVLYVALLYRDRNFSSTLGYNDKFSKYTKISTAVIRYIKLDQLNRLVYQIYAEKEAKGMNDRSSYYRSTDGC